MSVSYVKEYPPVDDISFVFNALKHTCTEGSRLFYIYGGAPRDILRAAPIRDIDVYIQDFQNINRFLCFLKRADRLRKETMIQSGEHNQYSFLTLEVQTSAAKVCTVDITSDKSTPYPNAEYAITTCDFTCNNLLIDHQGRIATRISPPDIDLHPVLWTTRCVSDAVAGKLTWMVSDRAVRALGPKAYRDFIRVAKDRMEKMLSKGFTHPVDSLSAFRCQELSTYHPTDDAVCAICKEDYAYDDIGKDILLLKCNHHFHLECINSWLESGRYHNTCPTCRAVVEWTYVDDSSPSPPSQT